MSAVRYALVVLAACGSAAPPQAPPPVKSDRLALGFACDGEHCFDAPSRCSGTCTRNEFAHCAELPAGWSCFESHVKCKLTTGDARCLLLRDRWPTLPRPALPPLDDPPPTDLIDDGFVCFEAWSSGCYEALSRCKRWEQRSHEEQPYVGTDLPCQPYDTAYCGKRADGTWFCSRRADHCKSVTSDDTCIEPRGRWPN